MACLSHNIVYIIDATDFAKQGSGEAAVMLLNLPDYTDHRTSSTVVLKV